MLKKGIRVIFVKTVGLYINVLFFLRPKKAIQLSYDLFTQPRKGKIPDNKLPYVLRKTTQEQLQHHTDTFQTYTWKGNATKILLVHGWESNSARWKKLLPHLQKSGATIIAIDAPAHGKSSGKEFNIAKHSEIIKKMVDLHQPKYIIGHSIGGASCIFHQYLYPENSIQKMVILGSPSDLKTLLEHYIGLLSLSPKLYPHLKNKYLENFNTPFKDLSLSEIASNIEIEGIIAHDLNDTTVAYQEGEKIAKTWKKGKFITTKDLGHSMHDSKLYQQISNFLFEQ